MFGRRRRQAPDPDLLEGAREHARQLVLPGFLTRDHTVSALIEIFEDEPLEPAVLTGLVDEVWNARLAEQRSWTDQGDYERLAAAFVDLEQAGIVARMDFTCCQNCGHTEIHDEATGTERGYTFFHQQDTERLADDDAELFLAYGVLSSHPSIDQPTYRQAAEGDQDARDQLGPVFTVLEAEIRREVVGTLQRHGLEVQQRDELSRPAVQVPNWRKPLPA